MLAHAYCCVTVAESSGDAVVVAAAELHILYTVLSTVHV
jgi:hypothetical protein